MKRTIAAVSYIAAYVATGLGLAAIAQLCVVVVATFLFAFTFVFWASGSRVAAVSIVIILTIVFPVVILLFIGSPVYPSWIDTFTVIVTTSRRDGILHGFEWFVPLLGTFAGLIAAGYWRSNQSFKLGRAKNSAPLN